MRCTDGSAPAFQPAPLSVFPSYPAVNRLACILFPWLLSSLDHFPPLSTAEMFSYRCRVLAVLGGCFFIRTVSIRKCGQDLCQDDQVCCVQGTNTTAVTCCKEFVDKTYYNIAMVTRKLSGVLIMLLLFAVGYFVQRMLCSRSRQLTASHSGQPAVATSQEPLVESCTPDCSVDPAPVARLPTYDACKHLPTYEETVRDDGRRGRPQAPVEVAT
uniref:Uncharacterized protein n=1 Tax=Anabas testudineus TaxID=64144 RepID=A0A7N6FEL4_ANATE